MFETCKRILPALSLSMITLIAFQNCGNTALKITDPTTESEFASVVDTEVASATPTPAMTPAPTPTATPVLNPNDRQSYRGYVIDYSEVTNRSNLPAILKSIEVQIDIVERVNANSATKDFFRSVVIRVRPNLGDLGKYSSTNGMLMNAAVVAQEKIVLLHELLHAYHDQVLGFNDSNVEMYFQRAVMRDLYPASYMRTNNREFFAVTVSVALSMAPIDRPPYTDGELSNVMPEWRQWIRQRMQE